MDVRKIKPNKHVIGIGIALFVGAATFPAIMATIYEVLLHHKTLTPEGLTALVWGSYIIQLLLFATLWKPYRRITVVAFWTSVIGWAWLPVGLIFVWPV